MNRDYVHCSHVAIIEQSVGKLFVRLTVWSYYTLEIFEDQSNLFAHVA